MTKLASLCRIALATALPLLLASACGGNSFSTGDGDGDVGDSGSGGKQSQAGTHSTAGKSTAGNGSGGSGTAGTGTGGSGSAGSGTGGGSPGGEACNAPAETGNCEAYFERWFHDPTTGLCRPFVYGGCGGNENNYETFEACQKACPGGAPNYDACTAPTDCVITGAGCCGICDGPDITARDLIAYNRKFEGQVLSCNLLPCAPCPEPAPGEGALQYFVPTCVQGQCAALDIRTSPVTACQSVMDCRLRHGTGCCEGCGGSSDIVSVRNDGSLEKLVCGDEPIGCPACAPLPPQGMEAVCTAGRCDIAFVPVAGN